MKMIFIIILFHVKKKVFGSVAKISGLAEASAAAPPLNYNREAGRRCRDTNAASQKDLS